MNKNSINISNLVTVGYSVNKEITVGMFKSTLTMIRINKNKSIRIIDVIGNIVKWAYENKKGHTGLVRTTKIIFHKNSYCINIRGKNYKLF